MVRTTLGAEVDTTVTVSGSESVEFISADISGPVSSGSEATSTIRPPTGTVYELIVLKLTVPNPGGTSSNEHDIQLQSEVKTIPILRGRSSGDKRIINRAGELVQADKQELPSSPAAQVTALKGARASETSGYQFRYTNSSGSNQPGPIGVKLWVRAIQVG